MKKQPLLFIQGGGDDGYEADKALVNSLRESLGNQYEIHYPAMPSDESAPDFGWLQQIDSEVSENEDGVILVAHSLGASMLLKYISEYPVIKKIKGIFLIATPHWSGDEEWQAGLKLKKDFAKKLPDKVPLYLYHSRDDEEVSFAYLDYYKQNLNQATFREIKSGGHQLNNDLTIVANDINSLSK
ncbi:RBBP9/YdeN family alpha/beta hydrolase [Persicitalea jodogahamensis]|uniref:Alpha/beta hydrolase n=1 Tax=Persicitalea jodogahamensis TaxID=402147 RepID=A0A8J3D8M4_9BACT|nr:alpha/beta hydrolase [Persicitalea jodogahamensis]GHB65913.1 alpha/beta hydrolase [Persicitalea jodogahamensis]